jgi:exodeoxyribonuclease VII small subunit
MTKAKDKAAGAEAPTFEKALARLEVIVERLDDGNLGLDESIVLFKEGTQLAKLCRDKLAHAEVQVKDALDDSGEDDEPDEES